MGDRSGHARTFAAHEGVPFEVVASESEGWDLQYFQVEPGAHKADLLQLQLDGVAVTLDRIRRVIEVRGRTPHNMVAFGFAGDEHAEVVWRGEEVTTDTVVYIPPTDAIDIRFRGQMLAIVVDRSALGRELGREQLEKALGFDRVLLSPRAAAKLRQFSLDVLSVFQESPALIDSAAVCGAVRGDLLERVAGVLRLVMESPNVRDMSSDPAARLKAASAAEAIMLERLHEPITVGQLARASSVSERTLRAGFVERFGHGPKEHLTKLRLSSVRAALRRSTAKSTTITELATKHCFWHLGRFAGQYRDQFGELPSDTLRDGRPA